MNKRRNIYRGINKRRNNVAKGFTLGLVIVSIAGGILFIKSIPTLDVFSILPLLLKIY